GDGDIAKWRVMHRALKLVSPCCVRKDALDSETHFGGSLSLSNRSRKATRDLLPALRKILRHVVHHLRAIVGCPLTPTRSFTRRLNCRGAPTQSQKYRRRNSAQYPHGN